MTSERFPTFCEQGRCELYPDQGDQGKRVCASMQEIMLDTGGADLLEIVKCPWLALNRLASEHDEPRLLDLKNKLGIIGIVEGPIDA